MPVEPGIVDANVLVYAFDVKAPQHVASRTLLDAARTGATTLYVTSQVLCEFYSIVTNARRVVNPRTSSDALAAISDLLGFLRVLPVPVTAIDELMALLLRNPVIGGEIFDLPIVATMKLNGIPRIYTFNTEDFKPFQEIEAFMP
jgi:predicted nucleic acid-binding protein